MSTVTSEVVVTHFRSVCQLRESMFAGGHGALYGTLNIEVVDEGELEVTGESADCARLAMEQVADELALSISCRRHWGGKTLSVDWSPPQ